MLTHGKERAYRNGCRCDLCQEWRKQENANQRRHRIGQPPRRVKNPSHGTERKYHAGCRCESCRAAYDGQKARTRRWQQTEAGKNTGRAYASQYRDTHRDELRAYGQQWREKNRDHVRAAFRQWRADNREHVRAYMAQWRKAHQDEIGAYQRDYRKAHRSPNGHRFTVRGAQTIATNWPFVRAAADLDPITAQIHAAVPRNLPEHVRQDACQELAIVLLTGGQLSPATITAAVRDAWKLAPGGRRDLSLDAAMPSRDGDSRERWIDRLPDMAAIEWLQSAGATRAHA